MHRLYIIARTDLDSMNPGKLAAQVAHAATAHAMQCAGTHEFKQWASEGYDFGTTIVLQPRHRGDFVSATETLARLVSSVNATYLDNPISYGKVLDPSYPIKDGLVTHLVPVETCVWAFLDPESQNDVTAYLRNPSIFSLHK